MNRKRWNAALAMLLVGMLVILAGCQPVGGADLTQIISKSFTVKSGESRQTITLELTKDPSAQLTQEQQAMFDLFGKLKLNVTEAKVQDPLHMSMKGTLEYSTGSIPFEFVSSDRTYTIKVEGAKKPIVVRNTPAVPGDLPQMTEALKAQMEQLGKKAVEAVPKLGTFFSKNLPNPSVLSVSQVNDSVNGESLSLQKIHAEIYGSDLLALVKGFLTSVLADEQGLKDFIGIVYDLYVPIVKQSMQDSGAAAGDNPMAQSMAPYLENKTLAVEFIFTYMKTSLQKFLTNFDAGAAAFLASEQGAKVKELLSERLALKMDYFVDGDQFIRKSVTEFNLTLPSGKGNSLQGLKVTSTSEAWNVNKPMTAAAIDTSAGVYDLNGSSGRPSAGRFLAGLDPNSQLYKLLKNDLHVTKKVIMLHMGGSDMDQILHGMSMKPYNDNGTVMVPVRFVTEQLDSDVTWDATARQVTIVDPLSGNMLLLKIGSSDASVNDKNVVLEKPAVLVEGTTYVPVRFVTESFGANVQWDQDRQMVIISRD